MAALAVSLGLLPGTDPWDVLNANKGLFWSNNPVSTALVSCLTSLQQAGLLDQNEDGQLRWCPEPPAV
jgi:hypothetical protein